MKNIIAVVLCISIIGCASRKMSETEKTAVLKELKYIYETDQKYAGLPPKELTEKYGDKKGWEIFLSKRDSVGNNNQHRN